MATLATETWTGSNNAAWPTQWIAGSSQGGTGGGATIQSNAGRLLADGNGYRRVNRYLNVANAGTSEVYVEVTIGATTEHYVYIFLRSQSSQGDQAYPNGYGVVLIPSGATVRTELGYGSGESLQTDNAFTFTAGARYGVRLRADGSTWKARVWNLTGTEPTAWLPSTTDGDNSFPTGRVQLGYTSGNAANPGVSFDNLTLTDGATGATGTLTLSGSGTLANTGTPTISSTRALTGSGTLATSGAPRTTASAPLSGTGTLNLAGNASTSGSAALTGSGTLSLNGSSAAAGTAALTGAGTLTVTGQPTTTGTLATSSSGNLNATGQANTTSTVELTSSATLAAAGTPTTADALTLGSSGTTAATGQPHITGDTASLGAGTLALSGTAAVRAHVDLTGSGTLTYATAGAASGALTLSAIGNLQIVGQPSAASVLTLTGSGTASNTSSPSIGSVLTLTGTATLAAKQQQAQHRVIIAARISTQRPTPTIATRHATVATLTPRGRKAGINAGTTP